MKDVVRHFANAYYGLSHAMDELEYRWSRAYGIPSGGVLCISVCLDPIQTYFFEPCSMIYYGENKVFSRDEVREGDIPFWDAAEEILAAFRNGDHSPFPEKLIVDGVESTLNDEVLKHVKHN